MTDEFVPEADVEADVEDRPQRALAGGSSGEPVPEADAQEQSVAVEEHRVRVHSEHRDDVPEADRLDQEIAEPFDENDR